MSVLILKKRTKKEQEEWNKEFKRLAERFVPRLLTYLLETTEPHPFANEYRTMREDEYIGLLQSIKQNGVKNDIFIYENHILDGRNRWRACRELGVFPQGKIKIFEGTDKEAREFVDTQNLYRRHLDEWERYKHLASLSKKERKAQGYIDARTIKNVPQVEHSTKKPYSSPRVSEANTILQSAPPHIIEKLDTGELSMKEGYKKTQKYLKGVRERERAKEIQREQSLAPHKDNFTVYNKDIAGLVPVIEKESVDLIITDPPYLKEGIEQNIYTQIGRLADKVLKAGGLCVMFAGNYYTDKIYKQLGYKGTTLHYYWQIGYFLDGGSHQEARSRAGGEMIMTTIGWIPIIVFVKGKYTGKHLGHDRIFVSPPPNLKEGQEQHKWKKSEEGMDAVIDKFCIKGQTVLDCCMGSGSTGVSALQYGCEFIGAEPNEEYYNTALIRLEEAKK